MEIVQIRKKSF